MKSEQNILLNIFLPPMAVARKNNSSLQDRQVQVACVLTLLLWIPGIVYSLIVCYGADRQSCFEVTISQPQPLHTVPSFLYSYPTSPNSVVINAANLPAVSEEEQPPVNPFLPTEVIV